MVEVDIDVKVAHIQGLDLGRTFNNLKKEMVKDLQEGIRTSKNVFNRKMRSNKTNKYGNFPKGFDHWMVYTGSTMMEGFKMHSNSERAWVTLSEQKHRGHRKTGFSPQKGGWTYKQIIQEHNPKKDSEFFGITKRIEDFMKHSIEFKKWLTFDIKRGLGLF